jgi:hypothetical protein
MLKGNIWLCAFALIATPALAQNSGDIDARRAAVRELFVAREQDKMTDALIHSIAQNYVTETGQLHPGMPQQRLTLLRKAIEANLKETEGDYLNRQAELLAEKLSLDDIHAVTAFYQTPAGKRMADMAVTTVPEAGAEQMAWEYAAVRKASFDLISTLKPAP